MSYYVISVDWQAGNCMRKLYVSSRRRWFERRGYGDTLCTVNQMAKEVKEERRVRMTQEWWPIHQAIAVLHNRPLYAILYFFLYCTFQHLFQKDPPTPVHHTVCFYIKKRSLGIKICFVYTKSHQDKNSIFI